MDLIFALVQAALIIGKIFEIKPVKDFSWWLVFSPLEGVLLLAVFIVIFRE